MASINKMRPKRPTGTTEDRTPTISTITPYELVSRQRVADHDFSVMKIWHVPNTPPAEPQISERHKQSTAHQSVPT